MQRLAPGPYVVIKTTTKQSTRNTGPEDGEMWIRFIGLQQAREVECGRRARSRPIEKQAKG